MFSSDNKHGGKGLVSALTSVCGIIRFCDSAKYIEEERSAVKLQISLFFILLQAQSRD